MALEQVGAEAVLQGLASFVSGTDKMASSMEHLGDKLDDTARRSEGMNVKTVALGSAIGGILANAAMAATSAIVNLAQAGFGQLTDFIGDSIAASNEAAEVQARLNAVLESTGRASEISAEGINEIATALMNVTTADDEAIVGVETLLLRFSAIGKEVLPEVTERVLDMSEALGTSLQSAALQVGKALQDPEKGLVALGRAGVKFSDAQKEVIKNLVETGQKAAAQRIILDELERQFGGTARAAANTLGGALQQLGNRWGNLQEQIGDALAPIGREIASVLGNALSVVEKKFAELAADGTIARWSAQTAAFINVVAQGFGGLASTVATTFTTMARIVVTVGNIIMKALSLISPFTRHSPSLVEQVEVGVEQIVDAYTRVLEIRRPIGLAEDAIQRLGEAAASDGKKGLDTLKEAAENAKDAVSELEDKIKDAQDRIRDLAGTPISGETAVDDQIFQLEQERKRAQLAVIAARRNLRAGEQSGLSKESLKPLEDAVDAAERAEDAISDAMDEIRINADLTFDPMRRQIERLAEPIEELPFDVIVGGIKAAQDEIADAESKLGPAREAYNTLTLAVEQYTKRVEEAAAAGGGGGGGGGIGGIGGGGLDIPEFEMPEEFKSPIDAEQWQKDFDAAVESFNTTILPVFESIKSGLTEVNRFLDFSALGWRTLDEVAKEVANSIETNVTSKIRRLVEEMVRHFADNMKDAGLSTEKLAVDMGESLAKIELSIGGVTKQFQTFSDLMKIPIVGPFVAIMNSVIELIKWIDVLNGKKIMAAPTTPAAGFRVGPESGGSMAPPAEGEPTTGSSREPVSALTGSRPMPITTAGAGAGSNTTIQVGPNIVRNDMDIARQAYEIRRYNPASMR